MKIKKDFNLRTVMGQDIVMAEGASADNYGKMLKLNPTAALLWKRLKGKKFDLDTVAGIISEEFGLAPSQAQTEAADFIALLSTKGVIAD